MAQGEQLSFGLDSNRMTINELYERKLKESTDINEHMPRLKWYASQCTHVTEFGVRGGCSTVALLAGQPRSLTCYDVEPFKELDLFRQVAKSVGSEFVFFQQDDCQSEIAPTDLLFIDSRHTYEQLDRELRMHAGKVNHYIIMHDTYSMPDPANGAPENNGKEMWIAILKLIAWGDWEIREDFSNQNGLTVLGRKTWKN
jgi:hypothetical protein